MLDLFPREAANALDSVRRIAYEQFSTLDAILNRLGKYGLREPQSLDEFQKLATVCHDVTQTLSLYDNAIFKCDFDAFHTALEPANGNVFGVFWSWVSNKVFRDAYNSARKLRRAFALPWQLLVEIDNANGY